jgi:predicted esterase YcpF (UPF0227 family)
LTTLFYLHGFRSTPRSFKASLLAQRMQALGRNADWICPALPVSPAMAISEITKRLDDLAGDVCLIGSSLGGYYATWLAERFGYRAVLLNPAITPQRDLKNYLGEQSVYGSNETIVVRKEYLDELDALWVPTITSPDRYFLLAATGDELIDWRTMLAKYPGAKTHVIEGSDHGISDFSDYLEEVMKFADQSEK